MVNVSLKPRGGEGRICVTALPVTLEWTVQVKLMNVILIPVSEVSDYFFMPNQCLFFSLFQLNGLVNCYKRHPKLETRAWSDLGLSVTHI